MTGARATRSRVMVARRSFGGCDRPDIQYAANGKSWWMSKPCRGDQAKNTQIGNNTSTVGSVGQFSCSCSAGTTE